MSGSNGPSFFEYAPPILFIGGFALLCFYNFAVPKFLRSQYSFENVPDDSFHKLGDTLTGTIKFKSKASSRGETKQQMVDVVGYFGRMDIMIRRKDKAPDVGGEIFRTQVLLTPNGDMLTGKWSLPIPREPRGVSWDGKKISIEQTYQTPYLGTRKGWFIFRDPTRVAFYVGVSNLPYSLLTARFFHWKELELDLTKSESLAITPTAAAAAVTRSKQPQANDISRVDYAALRHDQEIARAIARGNKLEAIQLIKNKLDVNLDEALIIFGKL